MFSIIALANHEPLKRRSHKKSRAGCLACKSRRLKCDEVKPLCGNCSRHFVGKTECEYVAAKTTSVKQGTEKLAKSKPSTLDSTPQDSPVVEQLSSQEVVRSRSLPASISGELLDPFLTYPKTNVKGVDFLMKYYLKTAVYTSFPWQPPSTTNPTAKYYVPLVLNDPVLFHATLHLTLVRFHDRGASFPDVVSSQLHGETLRLLRERVEIEGKGGDVDISVSDQTIGAVVNIAAIEHEKGDSSMLKMHMDGLKRMIAIRGGLNAIRKTSPMVANRVFWMFVVAMHEIPYPPLDPVMLPFCSKDQGIASPLVGSKFEDIAPGTSDPPSLNYTQLGLCQSVATCLVSVQHVSRMVPSQHSFASAKSSLVILTRLCFLLSHLLSLPPIRNLLHLQGCIEMDFPAVISESTRYAILLYIFAPWRGLPPDGQSSVNQLVRKLIASLEDLLINPLTTKNVLVLWIFSAGGVAATENPSERKWFVDHLREMTDEMGILEWKDMKAALMQGIWHEQLCKQPYPALWEEVVASRMSLIEAD